MNIFSNHTFWKYPSPKCSIIIVYIMCRVGRYIKLCHLCYSYRFLEIHWDILQNSSYTNNANSLRSGQLFRLQRSRMTEWNTGHLKGIYKHASLSLRQTLKAAFGAENRADVDEKLAFSLAARVWFYNCTGPLYFTTMPWSWPSTAGKGDDGVFWTAH